MARPTLPADGANPWGSILRAAINDVSDRADAAAPTWQNISGKPAVVAEGTTPAAARTAIGAGTSNLAIGTGPTTAKAGDYTPTVADVPNLPASKVTSGTFDAARIPALAYSATGHNHDDRYYTEAEVDDMLTPVTATVHWNGTAWIDPDDNVTAVRPVAKRVLAFGGSTQPTFLTGGDVWVQDTAV